MAKQQASGSSMQKGGASQTRSNAQTRDSQAQLKAPSGISQGVTSGSEETGEYDETYNLVSILYHALQGAETYGKYIKDAERAGDNELVEFFQEVRDEEIDRAARAKRLLLDRLVDEEDLEDTDEEE